MSGHPITESKTILSGVCNVLLLIVLNSKMKFTVKYLLSNLMRKWNLFLDVSRISSLLDTEPYTWLSLLLPPQTSKCLPVLPSAGEKSFPNGDIHLVGIPGINSYTSVLIRKNQVVFSILLVCYGIMIKQVSLLKKSTNLWFDMFTHNLLDLDLGR